MEQRKKELNQQIDWIEQQNKNAYEWIKLKTKYQGFQNKLKLIIFEKLNEFNKKSSQIAETF